MYYDTMILWYTMIYYDTMILHNDICYKIRHYIIEQRWISANYVSEKKVLWIIIIKKGKCKYYHQSKTQNAMVKHINVKCHNLYPKKKKKKKNDYILYYNHHKKKTNK